KCSSSSSNEGSAEQHGSSASTVEPHSKHLRCLTQSCRSASQREFWLGQPVSWVAMPLILNISHWSQRTRCLGRALGAAVLDSSSFGSSSFFSDLLLSRFFAHSDLEPSSDFSDLVSFESADAPPSPVLGLSSSDLVVSFSRASSTFTVGSS